MLYGYPVAATAENWLHECLYEILESIHTRLQKAQPLPVWPEIIPEAYRDELRLYRSIKNALDAYIKVFCKLSAKNQKRIVQALHDQNQISLLLSCLHECDTIHDLPKTIRVPIETLFLSAFKALTQLDIRDRHYSLIYYDSETRSFTCPFCGFEFFEAPGAHREDLDHYLLKDDYPFAAANLLNLVPMGSKCNEKYKLVKDMLKRSDGTRRKSFDPYNHTGVRVSLRNSQPFAGEDGILPLWQVEFTPNTDEVTTWDEVFDIRTRYKRDVLNPRFYRWMRKFSDWFRKNIGRTSVTNQVLLEGLQRYYQDLELLDLEGPEFLRPLVFQMLYEHCQYGNQDLIDYIKDVITGGSD